LEHQAMSNGFAGHAGRAEPALAGWLSATVATLTAADLDDVADLLRQTQLESGPETDAITDRYVANWIAGAALLIGVRAAGHLVGYAMLKRGAGSAAWIGVVALSILEDYRRKGVGERLMRALLAAAGQGGDLSEIWLSVAPHNLPAQRLYEKLGFAARETWPQSLFVPAGYLTMLWRPDPSDL
jgi:ribosomal protein S18 acetylase RimI-like enzyme